jgi:RNA polymerase sigma factor (sigma-70 family)
MGNRPKIRSIRKSDEEVWQVLKLGDNAALECLFRRYYQDLYRYGIKLTGQPGLVEDHIQDLFLKIWNNRQHLADVSGVKTYLWTALRRRLITYTQQEAHRKKRLAGEPPEEPAIQFSPEELIIHRENRNQRVKALTRALNRLSGKHREIVYLKYYEGMSYEEIEQVMGISYQTARNYVYEGLKALREYMDGNPAGLAMAVVGGLFCLFFTWFV